MKNIRVWNFQKKKFFEEKIYGDFFIRLLYQGASSRLWRFILPLKLISKWMGFYYSSPLSKKKISLFIDNFKIDMNEYEKKDYRSFNDFFIRKFKQGQRIFLSEPEIFPAVAEGRYLFFDNINLNQAFDVKGSKMFLNDLMDPSDASCFKGGSCFVARLCPVDYHRYHYPDAGYTISSQFRGRSLDSVSPLALRVIPDLFQKNIRRASVLRTKNFGLIGYIEVGAMGVGKIIQSHPEENSFSRGDEKGYFLFGASTVIVFGEKGKWSLFSEFTQKTNEGFEVYLKLGEPIGQANLNKR